jgi:hypothetical protein
MIFDPFIAMIFDPAVVMIFVPAGNNKFDDAVIETFDLRVKILRPLRSRRLCPTYFDPSEPTLQRLF